MDESIIQIPLYTATAAWRRNIQLCGLQRNHPSILTSSGSLAAHGTLFSAARLALHNTDRALAVGLSALGAGGSIGLMPLDGPTPTLDGAARMRWFEMPSDAPLSSLDWRDGLLLAGTTRGRVLVSALYPDAAGAERAEVGAPLEASACLTAPAGAVRVGDLVVAPHSPAASTAARSVRVNSAAGVVAAVGCDVCVWDAARGGEPIYSFAPSGAAAAPLMVTQWAPRSSAVVLTGDYAGAVRLSDVRADPRTRTRAALALPASCGAAVRCADFNALLPFVLATAAADGSIAVFDCRAPAAPVRTVPSLQGDAGALQWMRLHTDVIASGGTDGTIAFWGLRAPPTYCVGRAQYGAPVSDVVATQTFVEQRVLGITCAGELTLTGLSRDALIALAPSIAPVDQTLTQSLGAQQRIHGVSPTRLSMEVSIDARASEDAIDASHLQERLRLGCGLLYARHLREAYEVIADCAMGYFSRRDTAIAAALVGLVDVVSVPSFDYAERLRDSPLTSSPSSTFAVQQFDELLLRTSSRLCITLPFNCIRNLSRPQSEDLQKLEALRLNTLLQRALHSGDASGVFAGLQLFLSNSGNVELIDSETVCGIASMLLRDAFADGERFVRTLIDLLVRPDGTVIARALARRLLLVVQEPLVTSGSDPRDSRRRESRFLRHLSDARDAVDVQLTILRLGASRPRAVISAVHAYQRRCLARGQSGFFGWLALRPLLLFLHCLAADSNYAVLFWAGVQLVEALARGAGARRVEETLRAIVDRIAAAAARLRAEIQQAAEGARLAPPAMRAAAKALGTAHGFLVVLLRVELQCENVAVESQMPQVPTLMRDILDALSAASSELLLSWAALLKTLAACRSRNLARKMCGPPVRSFARRVEELMDVSCKKEEDETLNEILDTCEEFFHAVVTEKDAKDEEDEDEGEE